MTWRISYHVCSRDRFNPKDPGCYHKFEVASVEEAKQEILKFVKKRVARLRSLRGRSFFVLAMPYHSNGQVLDGSMMVRTRSEYENRKILRVMNPDVAFYYGYGESVRDKL